MSGEEKRGVVKKTKEKRKGRGVLRNRVERSGEMKK